MSAEVGQPAPLFELKTLDGEAMSLSGILQAGPAVLVFLRHLG